jgi:hypothetical protein
VKPVKTAKYFSVLWSCFEHSVMSMLVVVHEFVMLSMGIANEFVFELECKDK